MPDRRSDAAVGPELCWVTRELDPLTPGGIGAAVRGLAAEAAERGARCHLLVDLPPRRLAGRAWRAGLPGGVAVHAVSRLARGVPPAHAFRSPAYWRSFRIWRALQALAQRVPLAGVEFPDYEGPGFVALKAARLGLPCAGGAALRVRLHGTAELAARADERPAPDPASLQTFAMERYALQHAHAVVTPGESVADWYEAEGVALGGPRIVHPPPTPVVEARGPVRRREGGPLRIVFVGKLQPLKGARELVDAVARLLRARGPEAAELHLVGADAPGRFGPSHRAELRARIPAALEGAFHFHGPLPRERAMALAAGCHLGALPSRMETWCLAAHELRALGLPLLVSDLPAFRDAFAADPHVTRTAPTPEALARALEARLEAPREAAPTAPARAAPDARQPPWPSVAPEPTPPPVARPERVSVLVPYHEMHATVREALASVEASDHPDWEIVLVDDGSRSPEARAAFDRLREEHRGDDRYLFVRQENRGLAAARNTAVRHARGACVLPLDPDDRIDPRYLRLAVGALQRCPELGFVSCIAALFREGASPRRPRQWIVPYDPSLALLLLENGAGTAGSVFRREVLQGHPYDETLPAYEDWDLHVALARAGVRGECLPEPLYFYRVRREGLAEGLAHGAHDLLLARIVEHRLADVPEEVRRGLLAHASLGAALRGLGPGARGPAPGLRGLAASWARRAWHAGVKERASRVLSERQQARLVQGVRALLGERRIRPRP